MSIDISVSNYKSNNCKSILNKLLKFGINCRTIETTSIVDKKLENGCLITLSNLDNSKKNITNVWNIINDNNDYECGHLKIDGVFNGCIFNYIKSDFCPPFK